MQSDYMTIFKDIFYDVKQDEEMYEAIQASCELIGSVIVKYGEILNEMKELSDFDIGLKVSGKLLPKRIKGGVVLIDTYFEMR